jgi:hypothetical protein
VINFQLWDANDFEHRLKPKTVGYYTCLKSFRIEDNDIEVNTKETMEIRFRIQRKDFMLLNKRPPALPRINVEFRRKSKNEIYLKSNSCNSGWRLLLTKIYFVNDSIKYRRIPFNRK